MTGLFQLTLTIVVACISGGLMFFVYRKNGFNILSNIFATINVCFVCWSLNVYFATQPRFFSHTLILARTSMVFAIWMCFCIFYLSDILVRRTAALRPVAVVLLVISLVLTPFCFTPLIFRATSAMGAGFVTLPGPLMKVFSLFVIATVVGCVQILSKGIKTETNQNTRRSYWLVLVGFTGMNLLFTVTVMLPILFLQNAFFVQYGNLYILFFLLCTTAAIVQYELFNIRVFITEMLVILLLVIVAFQILLSNTNTLENHSAVVFFKASTISIVFVLAFLLIRSIRREIYQHKELNRLAALETTNKRLEQLDRQKTEFLNIAAHQLRTPVSIINGYIAMIQENDFGPVPAPLASVIKNIASSNEWLVRLSDELIDISRLDAGETKYHKATFSITEMAERAVNDLSARAQQKQLSLSIEASPLSFFGDEEKIRHALVNLIENAIKYSDTGLIRVLIDQFENGCRVRVIDQGIGFAPHEEELFFQKFSRGRTAAEREVNISSGLGLYICRMFVEGHGGHVWAKSEGLNKGSEFGFWVPM